MPATVETRPVRSTAWPTALRRLVLAGSVALLARAACRACPSPPGRSMPAPRRAPRAATSGASPRGYEKDPSDLGTAMAYAHALRATDQGPQAAAVLQQAALRKPKNPAVLSAYGKSLAEIGRFSEAAEVLRNAHSPANPDWRVLSAQGRGRRPDGRQRPGPSAIRGRRSRSCPASRR